VGYGGARFPVLPPPPPFGFLSQPLAMLSSPLSAALHSLSPLRRFTFSLPSPPLYILSPLSAALHSLSSPLSAALHSLSSLLQEDKVLSAKRGEELAHKVRARHPARPPRPRVTSCATLDGMPSGVPGGTRRRATLLLQFPGRIRPPKPNQPKS
jgi:hypothetical protein